ncbi:hypothetical protein [Actinoplanes sp. URMC 104]|uniref:hypothetical protein n=1 Tax=Actinoplanes sp. URMC 104 TaxID=3423409 RepID=UPI003F1C3200
MKKSIVSLLVVGITGAATAATFVGTAAAQERVVPAAAPAAVAPAVRATPPAIDAGSPGLTYRQNGKVVTVKKGSASVATVTLTSADYASRSADVVLSVAATRPFTVDPAMFTLYDAEGWENDAAQTKPVRFGAGTGTLKLTFPRTAARPLALGWVPQEDEAAAAVWERD